MIELQDGRQKRCHLDQLRSRETDDDMQDMSETVVDDSIPFSLPTGSSAQNVELMLQCLWNPNMTRHTQLSHLSCLNQALFEVILAGKESKANGLSQGRTEHFYVSTHHFVIGYAYHMSFL